MEVVQELFRATCTATEFVGMGQGYYDHSNDDDHNSNVVRPHLHNKSMLPVFARLASLKHSATAAATTEAKIHNELLLGKRVRNYFSVEEEAFILTVVRKHISCRFPELLLKAATTVVSSWKNMDKRTPIKKPLSLNKCFFIPVKEEEEEERDSKGYNAAETAVASPGTGATVPSTASTTASKADECPLDVEDASYYFQLKECLTKKDKVVLVNKNNIAVTVTAINSNAIEDNDDPPLVNKDIPQTPSKAGQERTEPISALSVSATTLPIRGLRIVTPEKLQQHPTNSRATRASVMQKETEKKRKKNKREVTPRSLKVLFQALDQIPTPDPEEVLGESKPPPVKALFTSNDKVSVPGQVELTVTVTEGTSGGGNRTLERMQLHKYPLPKRIRLTKRKRMPEYEDILGGVW